VGRAQRVSIRSLGWDGQLTIDGITSIPFNFGVQGIVEVRTCLTTVALVGLFIWDQLE
jgi:hypothetical protein